MSNDTFRRPPDGPGTVGRFVTPEAAFVAGVFLLALALRLAWIAYANADPNDGRFGDDLFYDHVARGLAAGKGLLGFAGQQTAEWPPGYPVILATIYKVVGHSILAPKVLNALAGAGTCVLVYLIGARVFSKRAGGVAAVVLAVFPGQIFFSTLLMTESIYAFLLAALLLLTLIVMSNERAASPLLLVPLGVLFGFGALMRGEGLLVLGVALIAWKLATPSWRVFAPRAGLVVAGAAIAIAPWTVRNAITMDAFVPVTSGVGHTFMAGHQDDPYAGYTVFPEGNLWVKYSYLPFPERELRVEREAMREGLDFARSHPGYEVKLFFQKYYHFFKDDSDALAWIQGAWIDATQVPWLADSWVAARPVVEPVMTISPPAEERWAFLADNYYRVVMLFALAGIPLWFSLRDRSRLLLVLLVVAWTALHLAFVPTARYRAAITPVFCLWAAPSLVLLWDLARSRLLKTPELARKAST